MAGDSTAVAIYKLAMESQQYVAAAQAAMQANQGLAASAAPVAAGEEKIDKALRGGEAALDRKIARFDAASRINAKYAKEFADLVKIEEAGIGSAEKRAQALAVVTAAHQKELEALDRVKKANAENAAALGSESAALKASAAAGDRYAQALLDMQRKLAEQNKELQIGNIGLALHAKNVNLIQEAYRNSTGSIASQEAAMRKSGTATGLARYELINLSRQFQDIGVSLAGGQSPFRILIEQGSQIADVFASSKAAFGDVFRNLIAWAARSATSIIGIVTATAALGAAAAALALQWATTQQSVERSLIGIGERAGLTLKQVNEIAAAASKQGGLSTPAARSAAEEFIKTGKMYGETVAAATNITDKFALAMGVSASEAAKQLAEILSDTSKGAETLDKSFGFLDGKTKESIRSLVANNEQQKAMLVLLNAIDPAVRKAADAASIWAKAWLYVTGALQNFVDRQGRNVMLVVDLWKGATAAVNETIAAMGEAFKRGQEFQLQREGGRARQGSPGRVAAQEAREPSAAAAPSRVVASKEALDSTTESAQRAAAALDNAAKSRDRLFGLEAEAAINSLIPQIAQLQQLEKTLNDVKRAQESGSVRGGMAAGIATNLKAAADIGAVLKLQFEATQEAAARAAAATLRLMSGAQGAASSTSLIKDAAQEGAVAIVRMGTGARGVSVEVVKIAAAADDGSVAIIRMGNAFKGMSPEVAKTLQALDGQIKVAEQLTGQAKLQAQEQARITQLIMEGKSAQEAVAIATKETALAQAQLATQHENNMAALQEQLNLARARTDEERLSAQYEADIASRIREGATEMQAAEEAAVKRKIAEQDIAKKNVEAANRQAEAEEKITEELTKQMYERIRATFELGKQLRESNKLAASAGELAAKLETIGTGAAKVTRDVGYVNFADISASRGTATGGSAVSAAGMSVPLSVDIIGLLGRGLISAINNTPARQMEQAMQGFIDQMQKQIDSTDPVKAREAQEAAAQAAEDAAKAQQDAAKEAQDAAKAQREAAKAAREAFISKLDETVKDIVATKLLAGQSAQAVNMLIEGGAIQFGTASTRFQTQLDLYKRAGASNAQIAADIRSGIIGEGTRPSELLAALDSLKDAVDANTAAQIGLSDFYTQQGDRLVGYRGLNVQTGIRSPVGGAGAGGVAGAGGISGTGTGGGIGTVGGGGGIMGGVVNPPGEVSAEGDPLAGAKIGTFFNGKYLYWDGTKWIDVPNATATRATSSSGTIYGGQYAGAFAFFEGGMSMSPSRLAAYGLPYPPGYAPTASSSYLQFAEGGIIDRPQMAMVGEAGPEAFVPLKGGAIPVRLTGNNDNKPTTVINITAPLINFMAEPTRDEVKESAFQAAQMLRRIAAS